jgi:hypothetical protein
MARKKNEISLLAMHIKALNNRFAFIGYLKMLFLYYFSFIPPGQGTSRNENLHKLLRRFLSGRPTISPQTFIALITTYVVHYNLRRQKKLQKNGQVWESSVQSDIHELFAQQIVEPFRSHA